jgi:methylglutaconyl-CoA hydratase
MSEAVLLRDLHDGILTLTLNRPAKRNALSAAMIERLHAELEQAELDAAVAVVAIRGAGPDFCAGADLQELLASADLTAEANERDALRLGTLFTRIRELPKVVVAVVQGRALAGGAGLATACDIVIASESTALGYPEMQRGFVPAMVMTLLRRLAGEKAALDLVLTGQSVTAADALRLGLVSRVVPDGQLDQVAGDILARLAVSSGSALTLTKRLFMELEGRSFAEGIALGARVNALARSTPDFRAAVAQFLAK